MNYGTVPWNKTLQSPKPFYEYTYWFLEIRIHSPFYTRPNLTFYIWNPGLYWFRIWEQMRLRNVLLSNAIEIGIGYHVIALDRRTFLSGIWMFIDEISLTHQKSIFESIVWQFVFLRYWDSRIFIFLQIHLQLNFCN